MRLDDLERKALKYSLKYFNGKIYLFGSRIDNKKKGGDIDLLLFVKDNRNLVELSIDIQKKFFSKCEQKLDIKIYKDDLFDREILKNAKRIDIKRI